MTCTWKDYADHDRLREMTLSGEEFLHRLLLHVLPDRFVRIHRIRCRIRCQGFLERIVVKLVMD